MNLLLEKKFEGFSNLSDEECGKIIENYLLEGFESETLFEREMMAKFLAYTYSGREPIRKIFNTAIKKNKQRVANFTVGEWLEKYSKAYEGKERTPNTFFEFVNNNSEIKNLNKIDKIRLMRIFRMYDYLLVESMPGLDDIRMNILRFPMYLNEENPEIPTFDQKIKPEGDYEARKPIRIESYSVMSAIAQYSQLGEQLITSSPIKLKIFPQPVRPSIKNWIEDYRSAMGAQRHGTMERGNYLFHSENTKNLVSGDRKKLAEVLRSLDEDVALKVDPERQEIVFQQEESHSSVRQEDKISNSPNHLISNKIPNTQIPNKIPDTKYQIPDTSMHFSSPHTLPNEKSNPVNYQSKITGQDDVERLWLAQKEKNATAQRNEPTIRGNVVDLKN